MQLFDHLKHLHAMSLYEDLKKLACLALTLSENQPEILSPLMKYQTLVYYGEAVYEEKEYKRAEVIFKKALQVKKWMSKHKTKLLAERNESSMTSESDVALMDTSSSSPKQLTSVTPPISPATQTSSAVPAVTAVKKNVKAPIKKTLKEKKLSEKTRKKKDGENDVGEEEDQGKEETKSVNGVLTEETSESQDVCSEGELKYKLYQCYSNTKQHREALSVLESVNAKVRNAKINMALAKLYHSMGMDRSAVTAYKAVLRDCPISLEACQGLLSLGVKGSEVCSLMMITNDPQSEWLSAWIRSQTCTACKDYSGATNIYKQLDVKPLLRDNVEVLCKMGEVQYLSGDYTHALQTLQRIHAVDSLFLNKMDLLASLLYKEKSWKELESLSCHLMKTTESAPESWIAMGYYCMGSHKTTKAIYFAQKAYTLDKTNVESLLLKGIALLELKKANDALPHFREILRLEPYRFEAHKGVVDSYVSLHRIREAITFAGQTVKQLGQSARTLTMYAKVLSHEPLNLDKAKSYLERAMKMETGYMDAVHVMVDILWQQQQYDKGIQLMRKCLQQHSTPRLHQLLADFLSHSNEHQEALDHYSIALSLDPSLVKAREGVERIEKQGDMGFDTTYDVEVDDINDINDTDNEGDLDGSDIESAAWSDIDLG